MREFVCAARSALLLAVMWVGSAGAVVVAPPPGQTVELLDERVLLVYDPLTASQTMVIQHTFAGTASPFGLVIPVPGPARVRTHSDRLRRAIDARLHPRGRVQRTLDVSLVSWSAGCALRDVGDGVPRAGEKAARPKGASGAASTLGSAPEPLHDWLLDNGLTVAPAQAAWLHELRAHGWGLVGVVVQPPTFEGTPPPRMKGPVLSVTHDASEPVYAARHPPFALVGGDGPRPRLELAVLSEWAVSPDIAKAPSPFFADALTERAVSRLSNDAGGLPWAFRREGNLTAFELARPTDALGVVRFVRVDPWPTTRPSPAPRVRANTFDLPIEVVLLLLGLAAYSWRRQGRRRLARGSKRVL